MPSNLNTYGDLSPRTAAFASKELLRRGQPQAVLELFGFFDAQGANKTTTRKWRRYEALAPATAPLVEGVTPAGSRLTYTDIEVTLQQYGDFTVVTDVIQDTHEDPVLNEVITIMSEQIVETIELVRFAALKGGTNVFYAAGVANRSLVDSPPLRGDLRKIYRSLKKFKANEITEIIKPSPNIATEPVARAFVLLGHTDLHADVANMTGFVPIEKYANMKPISEFEVGKVDQFRVILTNLFEPWLAAGVSGSTYLTNGASGTGKSDVYPMLALGKNAYAIVPLAGKNKVTPSVRNPQPVNGDELGQRGFASWKMWQACQILQETWMARYEVAATADPA